MASASVAAYHPPPLCAFHFLFFRFPKTYANGRHPALTKASKGMGVSRAVESPFGHHIVSSKPAMVSGGKNSTAPLPFAVFDIDDDEDETAGAGAAEPAALVSLVVALGVAFFLL